MLFRDVKLQPTDDFSRLKTIELSLPPAHGGLRLPQPCAALEGCRCRIYEARPSRCRHFDCALLLALNEGRLSQAAALRIIQNTLRRGAKVERLLRELGDCAAHRPLSRRVQLLTQRLAGLPLDRKPAHLLSELTLAYHALSLQLQARFLSLPPRPASSPPKAARRATQRRASKSNTKTTQRMMKAAK
jgi:hypothetical protein